MSSSYEMIVIPLLAGIGGFAFVGFIWNMVEGYFEEQRKEQR